jgi:hypothetical protein
MMGRCRPWHVGGAAVTPTHERGGPASRTCRTPWFHQVHQGQGWRSGSGRGWGPAGGKGTKVGGDCSRARWRHRGRGHRMPVHLVHRTHVPGYAEVNPFDGCMVEVLRTKVGEQLRAGDVQARQGPADSIWVLRLTPDAGTIKTGRARTVPLHADLVRQGFP